MSNMSYVMFENTYNDLQDCYESIDTDLPEIEEKYKLRLIALCRDIADDYEHLLEKK